MTTKRWKVALLLVVVIAGLVGCKSHRQPGERGELIFEYFADIDRGDFDKPIIVDGYLELYVYDVDEEEPVEIRDAKSLDEKVARVDDEVDNAFVVQGLAAGRARFEVRARDEAGQTRTDVIAFRVAAPKSVEFEASRAVATSGEIIDWEYLEGSTQKLEVTPDARVQIPWERRAANGDGLIGFGVFPIDIEPDGAATIHDRLTDGDTVTLFMPGEPQTFEVLPGEGCTGNRLVIEVVDPDEVTAGLPLNWAPIQPLGFGRSLLKWIVLWLLIGALMMWTLHSVSEEHRR